MEKIEALRDLDKYGIHSLTGEADNLSYRMLCDVTYKGYELMCEVLGLLATPATWYIDKRKVDGATDKSCIANTKYSRPIWNDGNGSEGMTTPPGWAGQMNSGSDTDPHVAGLMLPYDAWTWIAPIALLRDGYHTILDCSYEYETGLAKTPKRQTRYVMGLTGEEQYKSAPYDWEASKYTGPATLYYPEYKQWIPLHATVEKVYATSSHPHVGTRNVHAATGRSI